MMVLKRKIERRWMYGIISGGVGLSLLAILYMSGCLGRAAHDPQDGVDLVVEWNRYLLDAEMNTEGYRGPVASRAYGYIGMAAYEAGLPGMEGDFISLANYMPDLRLPSSPPADQYNMAIALNSCYAEILGHFFLGTTQPTNLKRIELRRKWDKILSHGVDTVTIKMSKTFGREVAQAVYAWSATDSLGYRANHHNYDRNYITPEGEGKWVSSIDFPMPPLLPYWGKVRPFVISTDAFIAKELPMYTTQTNQSYHVQALELISLSKPLSAENQWIAEFWNDDRPGLTFTPAGHWLAITNQVIKKVHPSIEKTLETYLRVGFALGDAMIACFESKYAYNLERPETYIQKHIDPDWRPFSPSPSFPSYPSGHSMMGAAAAEVLTAMFGETFKLTDKSHQGLEDFSVKPRGFISFEEMARENALSRMLLGVHWRMDCEEGMRLGELIGQEVNQLRLEEKLTE